MAAMPISPRRVIGDGRSQISSARPRPSAAPSIETFDMANGDSGAEEADVTPAKKTRVTPGAILMCSSYRTRGQCQTEGCPYQHALPPRSQDVAPSPVRASPKPPTHASGLGEGDVVGADSSTWGLLDPSATPVAVPIDPFPKIETFQMDIASRISKFETKTKESMDEALSGNKR